MEEKWKEKEKNMVNNKGKGRGGKKWQ